MTQQIANVSCVAIEGRAILIEGPPGSGKTSLALALIDRGATLVGDDAIELAEMNGLPVACPSPQIAGKIEVRNVGIVEMKTVQAPISIVLSIEGESPRYPLEIGRRSLLGHSIPCIAFHAGDAIQALRAEFALEKHGTPLRSSTPSGARDDT